MTASRILAATPQREAGSDDEPSYSIIVASTEDEIRAAQRLRYEIFAEEMGARLHSPVDGLDVDEFDQYCDHLVVRENRTGQRG